MKGSQFRDDLFDLWCHHLCVFFPRLSGCPARRHQTSLDFVDYYFEVVPLVFSIIHHHHPPPRNNFKKYFEVRKLFESNSGTTTKYFICNLSDTILRGWVVSQEIILRWVIVFLKNILKCLLTKSTSDSFFLIILRGHLVFLLMVARMFF